VQNLESSPKTQWNDIIYRCL